MIILHVIVCFVLILVVLLQTGKGADLAGAFGLTGSQTAFGPRGANTLLSKATTWSAIIFMLTSMTLYVMESRRTGSAIREPAEAAAPGQTAPAPAAPAAGAPSEDQGTQQNPGGASTEQAPASPKP
jgi:preprotein translocase subunit SecG